ncbi:right-handed parallel beta-helix repeat-containing protein [Pedobacter panaciterrae]|uniref:right-handed parallel beta-helix repeat-containing protein n=1 Tax=Pedobacter panaciterrae TaxID=363849 RepID=UPI00155DB3CA|nr:right-handed parallel beta-helix repeat-containing protein [Pedobacter panaciterrae]NQX53246.1 right-handed parallel beta-helix repeat-containing protein [Pedobacter panaciterrae]
MKKIVLFLSLCLAQSFLVNAFFQETPGSGKLIYVSKSGNDSADGSFARPLLTISQAILKAEPGDQVIVRKGMYRELVVLNRSGASEQQRITIKAAKGETVSIRGSEQAKSWTKEKNGIWKLLIDTSSFKGIIFFNNVKMQQQNELKHVNGAVLSWIAENGGGKVMIKANFGKSNPNESLTEIPVRSSGISALENVNYIAIDGIHVSQVVSAISSIYGKQGGAIETGGGTHWIIQNCTVDNCSGVGISIGNTGKTYPEASPRNPELSNYKEIEKVGHHVIRNNHILNCGQAGIFGLAGGTASLINGNLIEKINTEGLYTGTESAGIRLAVAIDAVIKGNLIRQIKGKQGFGIYLGPLFQATRISENIISDTGADAIYLFNSHGPALVDNNVLASGNQAGKSGVKMLASEANVFIKNLFYNCSFTNERQPGKSVATSNYLPHTLVIKQTIPSLNIDHRWFGNVFVKQKLDTQSCTGCKIDYNNFVDDANFHLIHTERGANVKVNLKGNVTTHPEFNADFIGFFALSKQYIEYPNGNPKLPNSFLLLK